MLWRKTMHFMCVLGLLDYLTPFASKTFFGRYGIYRIRSRTWFIAVERDNLRQIMIRAHQLECNSETLCLIKTALRAEVCPGSVVSQFVLNHDWFLILWLPAHQQQHLCLSSGFGNTQAGCPPEAINHIWASCFRRRLPNLILRQSRSRDIRAALEDLLQTLADRARAFFAHRKLTWRLNSKPIGERNSLLALRSDYA